jgi:hypothetical protein
LATYKGKYKVKNPSKYRGDPTNVTYRSSWELHVFNYLDKNPDILQWASEEVVIPYKSPIDGRWHRYFVDVWVKTKDNKVSLIEIKPFKETQEPKKRSRVTRKYLTEVKTWGINQAKWKAAEEYCKDRKWKFIILTERELFKNRYK